MSRVLVLNPVDDVAIALDDIGAGETPEGDAVEATEGEEGAAAIEVPAIEAEDED